MDNIALPQILQALLSTGLGQQLIGGAYNWATGGNIFGFTPANYDPTKSAAFNYYNQQQARRISDFYGSSVHSAAYNGGLKYAAGFYQTLGYNQQEAMNRARAWSPVQDLILNTLVNPRIQAAASSMAGALYGRRDQWDGNARFGGDPRASKMPYLQAGNQLISSVMDSAVGGEFAGMGVSDVGEIASRMIGLGKFNMQGIGKAKNQQAAIDTRIRKFKTELESYADSIHALQDVIDGPVEKIMDAFEAFTGSKLVSTSAARVSMIANAARNIISKGVVNQGDLSRLASNQYSMIAPYGGTMGQAAGMALMTGAAVSAGVSIEGLSQGQLEHAMARMNAQSLADGSQRAAAGAYVHFLRTKGLQNGDDARALFMAEMTKGSGSFRDNVNRYINQNRVSSDELYSARATNIMGNPEFTAQLHMATYDSFEKSLKRKLGGGREANDILQLVRNVQDPAKLEEMLTAKHGERGYRLAEIIKSEAKLATGEDDEYAALGALGSIHNGARILNERRVSAAWGKIKNWKDATGIEGVAQALAANGLGAATVGDLFGAAFGLDPRRMASVAAGMAGKDGTIDATHMQAMIAQTAKELGVKQEEVAQFVGQWGSHRALGHKIAMLEGTGSAQETFRAKSKLLAAVSDGKIKTAADLDKKLKEFSADVKTGKDGLLIGEDLKTELLYRSMTGKLGAEAGAVDDAELAQFTKSREYYIQQKAYQNNEEGATKRAAVETQARSYAKKLRDQAFSAGKILTAKDFANDEKLKKWYKESGAKDAGVSEDAFIKEMTTDNSVVGLLQQLITLLTSGIKVEQK